MNQKEFGDQRWLLSSSAENKLDEEDDNDEEEALSLSDLPLFHQWRKENGDDDNDNKNNLLAREGGQDQEFDFCSLSKESEMCAADELFFKGQILPLRHSVSSEKGLLQHYDGGGGGGGYRRSSISRSDSMDHYYSSRSSSMSSSHHSSTSGSGSSSATAATTEHKPKLPPRIQFHSHPSPSPRLHFPSSRHGGAATAAHRSPIKKSSIWNVLRLGLLTPPPEITFHDLKARSSSRNSTSSNSSSIAAAEKKKKKKKTRPRILSDGCRCTANAVDTMAPRVVIIKRSASEGDAAAALHDRSAAGEKLTTKKAAAKKQLSHHRTFEWLKQLSVEGAADES